jgi:UDP-N-acetyl-D-mannosaminuronate dehydrogenase
MNFETISVIGLGYIGLPTAGVFASRKTNVIGVDVNQHAVDTINRGEIHIVEPELDVVIQGAVKAGYLQATTTPKPADAFFNCRSNAIFIRSYSWLAPSRSQLYRSRE